VAESDSPVADGDEGEAEGVMETMEELGVVTEVGSEVESPAVEEEEEEVMLVKELKDSLLERRKVYMVAVYCVGVIRE